LNGERLSVRHSEIVVVEEFRGDPIATSGSTRESAPARQTTWPMGNVGTLPRADAGTKGLFMSEAEAVMPTVKMTRLGEIYEALDITPDGDARTLLLDELRDELSRIDSDSIASLSEGSS
jgi:hypothetical protein